MPLCSTKDMLIKAQRGGYAVAAFNVENLEMAQAVIYAAVARRAPVILQTTPGTLQYAPPEAYFGIVSAIARDADVPVALHLDHGSGLELARQCREAGYTSLMIDGSKLPYEENIALTRRVKELAGDTPVEAELGTVGGKEDKQHSETIQYTSPDSAVDFVSRTGITSFAVAIGTAHGVYQGKPQLRLELLSEISKRVDIPLVLHGASGVPEDQVLACIARGICKVNYATELRIAFSQGVVNALWKNPDVIDPKKYLSAGRDRVFARAGELMSLCGCEGMA